MWDTHNLQVERFVCIVDTEIVGLIVRAIVQILLYGGLDQIAPDIHRLQVLVELLDKRVVDLSNSSVANEHKVVLAVKVFYVFQAHLNVTLQQQKEL
jgi:hypothetical protein